MKARWIAITLVYVALLVFMAWLTREKAVKYAREEQRRQEMYGESYSPTGPRLTAMNEIFTGAAGADPAAEAEIAAAEAAQELMARLKQRLQEAMADGGPAGAIGICSEVAPQIAADLSTEGGLQIGRVSLKPRNPDNAPDDFERAWLAGLAGQSTADNPVSAYFSEIPPQDGRVGEYRYLAPIYVQPLCIVCHGQPEQIPAEVRAFLDEEYPDDQATGYSVGDFRGAITVRIPMLMASPESGGE